MNKRHSRRAFLKTMAATGVGTVLSGSNLALSNTADDQKNQVVPQRQFGQTGIQVSSLALGGILDFNTNQLLLNQALKLGINYWNTADSYRGGKSEEGIGRFIARSPEIRSQLFLATKTEARSTMMMDIALNASLKNLKTNYIDLYLMHMVRYPKEWQRDEVTQWAQKAKSEGKIRHFGFSVHTNMVDNLNQAATLDWIDGIMFTYNYANQLSKKMSR